MCIIVSKKKGLELPTKEILRNCFNYNSDGAGIMFNDGKQVFIEKGFRPNTAIKMTLILVGAKSLLDAQDRFLIAFEGNFTILYRCIDVIEDYYSKIA